MKPKSLVILIIVIAALVALKLIFFPSVSNQPSQTLPTKPMPNAVSGYVIKPEKLENTLSASGTIVANEEVQLKPEVSGKIIALLLKEGSAVTKNELLVKINDADLQAQLKKLQLQYDLSNTKLNRQKELLKVNGISQEEFDDADNAVKTINADIALIQSQIAKTEIRAPFDGITGLKNVSDGGYVSAGTTIGNVLQTDPVKIDFSVSERYAPFIKKGVKVMFTIDGLRGDIQGEIYAVEPKIDMSTRTIMVRAICPNKEKTIFPGAFANIKVLLKDIEDAVMIPTEAVIPELRGKKVFIVKNGKAQPVMIETGIRTSDKVQVLSGLSQGDTVVTTGIMSIKADAPLKVLNIR